MKEYFIKAIKMKAEMVTNYLIEPIVLYDNKMEITFNSPIEKNPENKTSGSFYLCKKIKYLTKNINNIKQEYTIYIEFYV